MTSFMLAISVKKLARVVVVVAVVVAVAAALAQPLTMSSTYKTVIRMVHLPIHIKGLRLLAYRYNITHSLTQPNKGIDRHVNVMW
jgi:hypothetical protein